MLPVIPQRPMVADYFKKKKLTDELVAEHLTGMLEKIFRAIEKKDVSKIKVRNAR